MMSATGLAMQLKMRGRVSAPFDSVPPASLF